MRPCARMALVALLPVAVVLVGCGGAGQDAFGAFGNVVGSVVDSSTSVPVSGATVVVGGIEVSTDSGGLFSVTNIPTGEQRYSINAVGYVPVTGNTVRVNPGVSVSLEVALQPEMVGVGIVTGAVTHVSDGSPVSAVTVTAGALTATTNSLGAYTLENVPVGEVSVTFEKPTYSQVSETVTVAEGATHRLDVLMDIISVGAVAGTVVDSRTGAGIQGVSVFVEGTAVSTTTGADGTYLLENVPTGTHNVSYHRTGYQSETYSVTVVSGGTTAQDISLVAPATGTLTGTVYDLLSGTPVSGVAVTIVGLGRATTSGAEPAGVYTFTDVPSGFYDLQLSKTGYATLSAGPVSIDAGTTTVYDAQIQPLLARLEGFVFQLVAGGLVEPVQGATVRLGVSRTTTTAADGGYAFDDVPPLAAGAEYTVEASATGFRPNSARVEVPSGGVIVRVADIVLSTM